MRKSNLFVASSLMALCAAGNAFAQASDVEQVEVSASRITISGYTQPTPVTVVGSADLAREAKPDLGDALRELPQVGQSSSATNGASAGNISAATVGLDTVNLRNLGTTRTLVLFDGQRVVQSNNNGVTDLATVPTTLVERVDVVTGGASAVWGSDAVSGVVNVVINKKFEGLKGNFQAGDNYNWKLPNYKGELAYGTSFDGDRGHIVVAGDYFATPGILYPRQADWYQGQVALTNNPAYTATNGLPQLIHTPIGLSQATSGGLVTASAKGVAGAGVTQPLAAANAYANIQFVGAAGTPQPFNAGTVTGALATGPSAQTYYSDISGLTVNQHKTTLFAEATYKLTPDITASVQLNWGRSYTENASIPATKFANQTIQADNAYLDPTFAAQLRATGVSNITIGTLNTNNYTNFSDPSLAGFLQTYGIPVNRTDRQMQRAVVSLAGGLGNDWSWNVYYQFGQTRISDHVLNNVINANYNNAVDAVRNAQGTIVCRSAAAQAAGCAPLDVIGDGVASQAAINYITYHNDYEHIVLNQNVVSASMQGKLPWELPAGAVAVAFGAEHRQEAGVITDDPLAEANAFPVGNFKAFRGYYHVEEGFLEVNAPLLRDTIVQSLDLSAAGRMTSYSTSGLVETYKLGLTSQVVDDVKARFTYSVDIRAPNLSELFSAGVFTSNTFANPFDPAHPNVCCYTVTRGNSALQPEVATTLSGGIVYTPSFIDGLTMSADWYSILIHSAIYTTPATTVVQQCIAGVTYYCGPQFYHFVTPTLPDQVFTQPANVAAETVSGLDFQVDYTMPFWDGNLGWHMVGNYTDEQTRRVLGVLSDASGCLGSQCIFPGVPKFRSTISGTYSWGPYSLTAQTRLIGTARLNNLWTSANVDNNTVPFFAYLDLRGSYAITDQFQIYGAMDNVTDKSPAIIPSTVGNAQNAYYFAPVRGDIYDTNGRTFRAGVRFDLE
jgi:outer membrane receptor protein involved in Fe transport